jgi:hypothetical protein
MLNQIVMQHVALFMQQCKETGVIEDFIFVIHENLPTQDIDMFNTINRTAWLNNPHCFTVGNILIDASQATMEKLQETRDTNYNHLKTLTSPHDPKNHHLASRYLISFQNRQ